MGISRWPAPPKGSSPEPLKPTGLLDRDRREEPWEEETEGWEEGRVIDICYIHQHRANFTAVFVKVWYLSTQWSCGGHKIYCRIKLNNNAVFVKVWYLSIQWSCGGHKYSVE